MKKYSCIIIIGLAVAAGCKKADYLLYEGAARIPNGRYQLLRASLSYMKHRLF